MRRALGAALAALLLVAAASRPTPAPFAFAKSPYVFAFPSDHAAHPAYQSEWWYFTGHLRATNGRRFGYELTFFRVRLRPEDVVPEPSGARRSRWRGDQVYAAHFAITDETGRTFFHSERVARSALGLGAAATSGLAVRADEWSLLGAPMTDPRLERMTLHAAAGGNQLDLVAVPLKPPAIHGRGGIFRKAACTTCASHYYSYTRLRTQGKITYQRATFSVDGTSWMDHEFGTDQLASDETGWDWFALQLGDGRELMLYLLRRKDGGYVPQSAGSLIERDGRVRTLPADRFKVTSKARWRGPQTHADYPSGWRVQVPEARLDVSLIPVLDTQEIVLTSGPSYWEGAVEVRDATTSRSLGQGYVELTGYAEPVSL
jgi:predicted secreted hydrolase